MSINIVDTLTLIGVIVGIIGIPWFLGRRFSRLETKINQICASHNSLNNLVGVIINLLFKRKLVDEEDRAKIVAEQINIQRVERIDANPISPKDLDKLNKVIVKARDSQPLKADEVQEFVEVVEKLQDERPDDPLTWKLTNFAAFLAGLYLGLNPEKEDPKVKAT